MNIINHSSYPTSELEPLIRFAAGDIHLPAVFVRPAAMTTRQHTEYPSSGATARPGYGTCPPHWPSSAFRRTSRYIEIQIAPNFPPILRRQRNGYGRRLGDLTWRETVIYTAAHEAYHVYQFAHNQYRKASVAELHADEFALKRIRQFRYGRERGYVKGTA